MPTVEQQMQDALARLVQEWDHRALVYPALKQMPDSGRPCNAAAMPTLLWPLRGQLRYGVACSEGGWRFRSIRQSELLFFNSDDWSIRNSDRAFCLIKIELQEAATLITVNDNAEKHFFEKSPVRSALIDEIGALAVDSSSSLSLVHLKSLLGLALVEWMRPQADAAGKARRSFLACCEHLREHLHEDINRQQVATAVGIHPGHVSRLFKQFYPGGYDGWLRGERMRRARQLLSDESLRVEDVAHLCGITNVSWFIRCFRRECGVTPAVFRQSLKI